MASIDARVSQIRSDFERHANDVMVKHGNDTDALLAALNMLTTCLPADSEAVLRLRLNVTLNCLNRLSPPKGATDAGARMREAHRQLALVQPHLGKLSVQLRQAWHFLLGRSSGMLGDAPAALHHLRDCMNESTNYLSHLASMEIGKLAMHQQHLKDAESHLRRAYDGFHAKTWERSLSGALLGVCLSIQFVSGGADKDIAALYQAERLLEDAAAELKPLNKWTPKLESYFDVVKSCVEEHERYANSIILPRIALAGHIPDDADAVDGGSLQPSGFGFDW